MATATDSGVTEEEILEEAGVENEAEASEDETTAEETEEAVEQEEETAEEAEQEFEKRFTQFKGETPEEYLKNLEDAYGNSTTEATRLAQQAKDLQQQIDQVRTLVANNPDFAAQLNGTAPKTPDGVGTMPLSNPQSPLADPALFYARQTMEQQMEREYNEFAQDHREMETDPALAKQVTEYLSVLSQTHLQKTGKLLGMAEGLRAAWVMAGKSLTDNDEDTRMAVKNAAGQQKSPGGRPAAPPAKEVFTKDQLDFAKRTWPEKSHDELVKMLSEYVQ